jgi:23S rRNA (pseudouridine1915-N3)-methyltransferase
MITILSIGRKHETWIQDGLERYQKRLRQPFDIEWVLLPHSSKNGQQARQEESERILSRLNPRDYVIVLDERGYQFTSPELSDMLSEQFTQGNRIVLVIGGAYGVSEELYDPNSLGAFRADAVWSLSKLVFPHQLVRLLLVEQLYRAQSIAAGLPYHHE